METEISNNKTSATVDEVTLTLHQSIKYKRPDAAIISDGKIEEFRLVDKGGLNSVWMYIIDIGTGDKEWISLKVWKELYDLKIYNHASSEPAVLEGYPF